MIQTLSVGAGRTLDCVIRIQPRVQSLSGMDRLWKPYREALRARAKYVVVVGGNRVRYSRNPGYSLAAHIERSVRAEAPGWAELPEICELFIPQRARAYRARIEYGSVSEEGMLDGADRVKAEVRTLGESARVLEGEHRQAVCDSDDLAVDLPFDDIERSRYRRPGLAFLAQGWLHPAQLTVPALLLAAWGVHAQLQDDGAEERLRLERLAEQARLQVQRAILDSRRNLCPVQWAGFKRLLAKDWAVRGQGVSALHMDADGLATWSGGDWSVGRRVEALRDFAAREGGRLRHDVGGWTVEMDERWAPEEALASEGLDMELWYSRWRIPVEQRGGTLRLGSIEDMEGGKEYKVSFAHSSGDGHALHLFETLLADMQCRMDAASVTYQADGQRRNLDVQITAFGPSALGGAS